MALRRPINTLKIYLGWLKKNKKPFTVDISHKTYTVKCKNHSRTFSANYLPIEGLNLVRSVKKYVKDNNIADNFPKLTPAQLGIQYICFDKNNIGKNIIGIKEIDMDKAYWTTGYQKGIIDKTIYDEGIELTKDGTKESKISRLVALGTLAKEVRQRIFNGQEYEKSIMVNDSSATKHLWNHICHGVDTVMKDCMKHLKNKFSFFWTDAIFFIPTGGNEQMVKDIIARYGYGSKTIDNAWYEFRADACYVFSKDKGRAIDDKQYKKIDLKWVVKNVDLKKYLDLSPKAKIGTGNKLKSLIQSKLKVRNFCYSITNEDIWKQKRKNKHID